MQCNCPSHGSVAALCACRSSRSWSCVNVLGDTGEGMIGCVSCNCFVCTNSGCERRDAACVDGSNSKLRNEAAMPASSMLGDEYVVATEGASADENGNGVGGRATGVDWNEGSCESGDLIVVSTVEGAAIGSSCTMKSGAAVDSAVVDGRSCFLSSQLASFIRG